MRILIVIEQSMLSKANGVRFLVGIAGQWINDLARDELLTNL